MHVRDEPRRCRRSWLGTADRLEADRLPAAGTESLADVVTAREVAADLGPGDSDRLDNVHQGRRSVTGRRHRRGAMASGDEQPQPLVDVQDDR